MKHEGFVCIDNRALGERIDFFRGGKKLKPEQKERLFEIYEQAIKQYGIRNYSDLVPLMAKNPVLFLDPDFII